MMHPFLLLENEGETVPPTFHTDTFPPPYPCVQIDEKRVSTLLKV